MCRLLDICIGRETPVETELMLVFEHIDQDLDIYLKNSPSDGIHPEKIKVTFIMSLAASV